MNHTPGKKRERSTSEWVTDRARLIAVAPDMLSELIEFCKGNCDTCRMKSCHETCGLKQAKELIERATGHKIKEVLV